MTTSWDLVNEIKSLSMGLWDILVQIPSSSFAGESRKEVEKSRPVSPDNWMSEQMTRGQLQEFAVALSNLYASSSKGVNLLP